VAIHHTVYFHTNYYKVHLLTPSGNREALILYTASISSEFLLKFDDPYGLHESGLIIEQTQINLDQLERIVKTLLHICEPWVADDSVADLLDQTQEIPEENVEGGGSYTVNTAKRKALADITEEKRNPPVGTDYGEPQPKRPKNLCQEKLVSGND
jgi:hypothetical protein